jgi:hypothetical protein
MSESKSVDHTLQSANRRRTSFALVVLILIGGAIVGIGLRVLPERTAAHRYACESNLEQIVLAMHIYHASWGSLPPAYLADEAGKPKHSWRVLLLPYLPAWDGDPKSPYETYDFSEPWDGPNNRQLVEQMPRVYRCPQEHGQSTESTSYVVVTGDESAFSGHSSVRLNEIGDGLDATILVAAIGGSGISWMEPRDVSLDQAVPAGDSPRSLVAKATHTAGVGIGLLTEKFRSYRARWIVRN